MRNFITFGIFTATIIGLCSAFPIRSANIERNTFLIGAFVLVSLVALVAGCVCCKRRKKGFEEFKNESGTLENKTEYPIFSALSPESQRNSQQSPNVVSVVVNNSDEENLVVNDIDNNNGPLSPADLENIVNNNAVDYIENQNEIGVVGREPSSLSRDRILIPDDSEAGSFLDSATEGGRRRTCRNQESRLSQQDENLESDDELLQNVEVSSAATSTVDYVEPEVSLLKSSPPQVSSLALASSASSNSSTENCQSKENDQSMDTCIAVQHDIVNLTSEITTLSQNTHKENDKLLNIREISFSNVSKNITNVSTTPDVSENTVVEPTRRVSSDKAVVTNVVKVHNSREEDNEEFEKSSVEIEKTAAVQLENVPIDKYLEKNNSVDSENLVDNSQNLNPIRKTEFLEKEESVESNYSENNAGEKALSNFLDDSFSLKSAESEKSCEVNSVEEALRVLDNVIEAEDISNNGENWTKDNQEQLQEHFINDDHQQEITENYETALLREFLQNNQQSDNISTNRNGILSNLTFEYVTSSITESEKLNAIKQEARILVDSVLNESQRIIEAKNEDRSLLNPEENSSGFDKNHIHQIYSITECHYYKNNKNNENVLFIPNNYNDLNVKKSIITEPKTELSHKPYSCIRDDNIDDEENEFFSRNDVMLAMSSTPCFQSKLLTSVTNPDRKISNNYTKRELFSSKTTPYDNKDLNDLNSNMELENEMNSELLLNNNKTFNINEDINKTEILEKTYDLKCNENSQMNTNNALIANKTFDMNGDNEQNEKCFTYPGDPCTSKQALERDFGYPTITLDKEVDINSEDLMTITPVNTPIELNCNNDVWDKTSRFNEFNSKIDNDRVIEESENSGWFLHPIQNDLDPGRVANNETFDVEENEDEGNLELTFDLLRKQLAEVLPQPQQNMTGPPDFSDDEDEQTANNRTFDEYRSPLDGLFGLLEIDSGPSTAPQNELFINYKRTLSPIIEESEEETCKTFVLNETKCLDSTSTGCVDTGEAIMGVTKTLMASNDTLFNFEDTLGEKEDIFSPKASSRCGSQANTPVRNHKSIIDDNSLATTSGSDTEKLSRNMSSSEGESGTGNNIFVTSEKRTPPKTIEFCNIADLKSDNTDIGSPDQQKTFSEGTTTSSTTDRDRSSDISPTTIDHDTTFTANTIDEKTCITVIIKDEERISEVSEPEWGSTASYGPCDMNSLTDVASIDLNLNSFENKDFQENYSNEEPVQYGEETIILAKNILSSEFDNHDTMKNYEHEENFESDNPDTNNDLEKVDSGHEDSGHSTQASTDEKSSNNSAHMLHKTLTNSIEKIIESSDLEISKEDCIKFIQKEIEISSSQKNSKSFNNNRICEDKEKENNENRKNDEEHEEEKKSANENVSLSTESLKENSDPNKKNLREKITITLLNPKVQINSQDPVIVVDKNSKHISSEKFLENELQKGGMHERNSFHQQPDRDSLTVTILSKCRNKEMPASALINNYKMILNNVNGSGGENVYDDDDDEDEDNYDEDDDDDIIGNEEDKNYLMVTEETLGHLSGEEDPWVETPVREIIPRQQMDLEVMNTSFSSSTNEWDSDVDDSHSSEEFMYVRGTGISPKEDNQNKEENTTESIENGVHKEQFFDTIGKNTKEMTEYFMTTGTIKSKGAATKVDSDKKSLNYDIPSSGDKEKYLKEEETSDGSSSEFEGEFIPSCWDSMAMPARSALKSPEKSSSGNKKRRSVAFKNQRYHSVYEYPKENASLSPAYSEPSLWKGFYDKSSFYNETRVEECADGFTVSSSMRPFHGSQFNALCHTWPTDSDFSWSQVENSETYQDDKSLATYMEMKWPQDFNKIQINNDDTQKNNKVNGEHKEIDILSSNNKNEENQIDKRPDSGVGASAEILNDRSSSLGELRHTKSSLRLPLEILPPLDSLPSSNHKLIMNEIDENSKKQQNHQPQQEVELESNEKERNFIFNSTATSIENSSSCLPLTTPSCTSSMDSLSSSSSSSERQQLSFTTFGKRNANINLIRKTKLKSNDNNNMNRDRDIILDDTDDNFVDEFLQQKIIHKEREIRPTLILIDGDISEDSSNDFHNISNSINETILMHHNEEEEDCNLIKSTDKIKQSDSTDEDSGIESIMKFNKD